MPLFSVIIPVYNRPDMVRRAIASVLAQTFTDYELIVVDDGSDDSTREAVEAFGRSVRILRTPHRGVSAARNAGVRAAAGQWIAFLDSDDEWLPDKLARHADYLAARPEVSIHQTGELWIRRGRRVNPRLRHLKREGHIFVPSLELCLISPSTVVLHRRLFDVYGFFDEMLPACEDYDLWLRITEREWVGLVPDALAVRHAGHPDQLSSRHWGMDRFRVYAIAKLLNARGDSMRDEYRSAAVAAAIAKSRIILAGAAKRGNTALCERIESFLVQLTSGSYELPIFLLEG